MLDLNWERVKKFELDKSFSVNDYFQPIEFKKDAVVEFPLDIITVSKNEKITRIEEERVYSEPEKDYVRIQPFLVSEEADSLEEAKEAFEKKS